MPHNSSSILFGPALACDLLGNDEQSLLASWGHALVFHFLAGPNEQIDVGLNRTATSCRARGKGRELVSGPCPTSRSGNSRPSYVVGRALRRNRYKLAQNPQDRHSTPHQERQVCWSEVALNSLQNAAMLLDRYGNVVDVNHSVLDLLGFKAKDEALLPFEKYFQILKICHPDSRPMAPAEFPSAEVLGGKEIRDLQMQVRIQSGQTKLFAVNALPLRGSGGDVDFIVITARDLTDMEKARALERLAPVAVVMAEARSFESLVQVVLDQAREAYGADMVLLWEADDRTRELRLLGQRDAPTDMVEALRTVSYDATLISCRALLERQIQVVQNIGALPPEMVDARKMAEIHKLSSIVAVPLEVRERVVGVMTLLSHAIRCPTMAELETLDTIGRLIAVGIENARLYTGLQNRAAQGKRREARLTALNRMAQELSSSLELDKVENTVVQAVAGVYGAEAAWLMLYREDTNMLETVRAAGRGKIWLTDFRIHPGEGVMGEVFAGKEPIVVPDVQADPRFVMKPEALASGIKSVIGLPLVSGGEAIGVLGLQLPELPGDRRVLAEELSYLSAFAGQAATAVQNARLFAQLRGLNEQLMTLSVRLRTLLDVAEDISSRLDIAEVLRRIVIHAVEILRARGGFLALREDDRVVVREWWDSRQWVPFSWHWQKGEGGPGWVWDTGKPLIVNEVSSNAHVVPEVATRLGAQRFLSAPLLTREGQFLGAIQVVNKAEDQPFTESDTRFVDAMSRHAAVALQNARLFDSERRRAAELAAVIENMAEGVTIADHQGRVLRINRMGLSLLGFSSPEETFNRVESYGVLDFRRPDGQPLPFNEWPINRALEGETFTGQEVVLRRRDGERRSMVFSGGPIRDDAGQIVLVVSVFRDITAIRKLEQQREDYIRIVAHDLRAPLTIVMGQAQLVRKAAQAGALDRVTRGAEAIATGARRMNTMIEDLVDVARLESGRLELTKRAVDLPTFVADLKQRMAATFPAERIQIETPTQGLPAVAADPDRLERILLNLLTNALKYSGPEAPVTVSFQQIDGQIETTVTDLGFGISPDDLPHLFERFYRAKGLRRAEGLGLGLYITRMLVEAHGGQVWAESQLGTGSKFHFTLPVTKAAEPH